MKTGRHGLATACLAILLGSVATAQQTARRDVTPGELIVEPPTLINLGFEWRIDGDTNRNAKVDVWYRKSGPSTSLTPSDSAWKTGMPLLRLQHEKVTQPNVFNLVSPNMFAGSILVGELALAQQPDARAGDSAAIFSVNTLTSHSSSDYNGFRLNPGAAVAFQWNVNVPKLDRDPKTVQRLYDFKDLDFRLRAGAAAIDRGIGLANINDGFAGKAPDLGALEAGQPLPIYGPRR